jgi:hypothetical protein
MAFVSKYQPSLVETKSWNEIEQFYADLISNGLPLDNIIPMIQFIKADDRLPHKVFACTSLDKLIISVYNPIELWREAVHIQYNREKESRDFKYYPLPYQEPEIKEVTLESY